MWHRFTYFSPSAKKHVLYFKTRALFWLDPPLPTSLELFFSFNNIFRQLVHYADAALHDVGGSGGWRKTEVGKYFIIFKNGYWPRSVPIFHS